MAKTTRRRAKTNVSQRAKQREREILHGAFEVFSEKGYRGASMEDIGERVGMLGGSIYYYFKSKEELLFTIWVESHAGHIDRIRQIEDSGGDARTKLRAFIISHVASYDPIAAQLFFGEFSKMSKSRRAHIAKLRKEYESYVVSLISAGKSEGIFSADVDEHVTASGLLSMLNSLHLWFDPKEETLEHIGDQYAQMIVDGISARRSRGQASRKGSKGKSRATA